MDYPNLEAIINGTVSGHVTEWPKIRTELQQLFSALAESEKRRQEAESQLAVCKEALEVIAGASISGGKYQSHSSLVKLAQQALSSLPSRADKIRAVVAAANDVYEDFDVTEIESKPTSVRNVWCAGRALKDTP